MQLHELIQKLVYVSDLYAQRFSLQRDTDWYLMKIQEELGELTAAHLRLTGRGRFQGKSRGEVEKNLREEVADLLAMTLLFAWNRGIDVETALRDKWLHHLEPKQTGAALQRNELQGPGPKTIPRTWETSDRPGSP